MHARIQTWFPFYVHVCSNGREWLARRMDREGLRYVRQENCFPWVEDIPRAQQLFQEQLQVNWTERLQPLAQRLNPLHEEIFGNYAGELTTDFKSRASGNRVKYRIDGNSLKGYGKASTPVGDLFRVET